MEQYQVDHLLLLVGSNPVPNAVAGKLLVKPGGTITLICSEDSLIVAQRLKSWLARDGIKLREPNDSKVDPTDPTSIFTIVGKALDKTPDVSVGLNYTGGTKAMSVHAYRTVEQWCKEKNVQPKFSYLDARTLTMVFDPEDPQSGSNSQNVSVSNQVELKLSEIMELQGWQINWEKEYVQTPLFPKTAAALARLYAGGDKKTRHWLDWLKYLESSIKKPKGDGQQALSQEEINVLQLPWVTSTEGSQLRQVVDTLKSELGLVDYFAFSKLSGIMGAGEFVEWLKDKWLEHHVLDIVKNQPDLHDCVLSLRTDAVEFEVDVVGLKGYQLFAFSCTTSSSKSTLKQKLFEATTRARQLGGDEACAALVCLYDDASKLQKEVRDIFGENNGSERIKVLGREHLANLSDEIAGWIKRQSNAQ